MDKLDISIVRELSQAQSMVPARVGLPASYRGMARTLKVSAGTIRNRVGKMYATGILMGSSVYLNPNLLSLKGGAFALEVSPELPKREVVDRFKLVDGSLFIHNFRGNMVGMALIYSDEASLRARLDLFKSIAGVEEDGIFSRVLYPSCSIHLSDEYWLLISRLSQQPFQSYAQLARELKVSPRTVLRRLSKLLAARAILSIPTLDYRAISGGIPADLVVVFEPKAKGEAEKKILQLVADYMVFAGVGEDFMVYNLVLPKMGMATDLGSTVKRVEGVNMARVELVDEHIDLTNRLWNYYQGIRLAEQKSTRSSKILPQTKLAVADL